MNDDRPTVSEPPVQQATPGTEIDGIRRVATTLNYLPVPSWLYDRRSLRFLAVNDATAHALGYDIDALLERRMTDFMSPAVAAALREYLRHAERPARRSGVWTLLRQDGEALHVDVSALDVSFRGHDVTLVTAYPIAVGEAAAPAPDRARLDTVLEPGRALALAGHELRNPLNVMVGYAELIALVTAQQKESQVREWAEMIVAAGTQLQGLITNLTDRARLEADRWQPRIAEVDLARTTLAAVEGLTGRERASDVELRVEFDLCDRVHRTDSLALSRIVANVVGNALKYTDTGSVTLTARCSGMLVSVEVQDTGIGIPREDLDVIFDAFERGSHGAALERSGSGLGLAVVRDFVAELNGKIAVESTVGEGTRFQIEIPVHS